MELHGFIMMHRKIMDWRWYSDINVRIVFIQLLLLASFKSTQWREIEVEPGQVILGRKAFAQKVGLTERQVRTALEKLEKTGEITIKTTNRFSLVTIVNWELYQGGSEKMSSRSQTEVYQQSDNRPHRNNVKNVNNVKKYMPAPKPQIFSSEGYDYEAIRKRAREKIRKKIGKAG